MILTVTLNPLLERRLFFDSVDIGKENRSLGEKYTAGGKGINVSRQLNLLGVKNSSFTFIGGANGKLLRHILTDEQIDFNIVATKSETRSVDLIIEEKRPRITTFFGPNSEITLEESTEFKNKLEKMIQNCSIVVFSGSSPGLTTDDIFPYGIESANKHDKISVLDTYGDHLKNCIEAGPTVIHNNNREIEKSLFITLHNEKDKLDFLKHLYSKNIKLCFLTDGSDPFYAGKFDFQYKVTPPKVDTVDSTGSGDAFIAGIIYGLHHSLVFEEFIKIATSLGAANAAKLETCNNTQEEMMAYKEQVKVESIGKKMKIIDDSPNY